MAAPFPFGKREGSGAPGGAARECAGQITPFGARLLRKPLASQRTAAAISVHGPGFLGRGRRFRG